jgi:hypothetical protein
LLLPFFTNGVHIWLDLSRACRTNRMMGTPTL